MEITVADQRVLLFTDQLAPDEAKAKAWDKKISTFDTISKFGSFLSKPRDDDFELIYSEHRIEPFWHVTATAKYVYDRNTDYQIPTSGGEVKGVTYQKSDYDVQNGHIHIPVTEHCETLENEEVFVDGVSGKNDPDLKKYLSLSPKEVTTTIDKIAAKETIVVPPQTRVSAIMRDSLSKMIKGIQADKILEEKVSVECVDLYYHPIYAFKFRWISKSKEAIVEVDGLTGDIRAGNRTFNEYLGKVLDKNFLFDLGADAAGIIIPGGSIAVKIAKKYIDRKSKK